MAFNNLKDLTENIRKRIDENYEKPDFYLLCLEQILEQYVGEDWLNYVNHSDDNYTRIKLPFTNLADKFEMFLICWNNNAISPIHNHPKNGCIVKMLKGSLNEVIYHIKKKNRIKTSYCHLLKDGDITYIDNTSGVHQIFNYFKKTAYSLHIYSPPNFEAKIYTLKR